MLYACNQLYLNKKINLKKTRKIEGKKKKEMGNHRVDKGSSGASHLSFYSHINTGIHWGLVSPVLRSPQSSDTNKPVSTG